MGALVSPEAGWYADPTDPSAVRWWDGSSWSAQTRPAPRELAMAGASVGAPSMAAVVTVGAGAPAPAPAHAAPAPATSPSIADPHPGSESDEQVADRSRPGARRATPPPPAPEPSGSGAPEGEAEDVDRSRPGARRPVAVPPVDVVTPAAVAPAAAPRPPVAPAAPPAAWVDGSAPPASPGHGFGGGAPAPAAFGAAVPGLASAPAGFGPADYGPGHGGGTYKAPRSWKIPVAVGIVSVLLLGAAAVVGIPRYQASQARDTAAQAPDVLVHAAPRTLAGQKKLVIPGLAGMAQALTADGAEWAWAQAYGTRDSFTLYLASDVPLSDRADAVKALTNHDAATHLLQQVSAGITSGSQAQAVPGTPAEYASPVGGKTWCMPITLSGVGGGYCLWTSGKEWLQVLSMPGLEQVAAKSTLTSLTQMAASVTQGGPTSSLVPKASTSAKAAAK